MPRAIDPAAMAWPSRQELDSVFRIKYGQPDAAGWSPRTRLQADYFLPADVYEAVVSRHVLPGCRWIDVGGGHSLFPTNPELSKIVAARCSKVVAVDPSANVERNPFVHERYRTTIEDYMPSDRSEEK